MLDLAPITAPAVFPRVCLVLGLCVGSFLNVVIHRLPKMLERTWHSQCAELRGEQLAPQPTFNLFAPRSACPHCGHHIRAWENVPVLSYVALRGCCSACKTRISPRYPIIEILTGLISAYVGWRFGLTLKCLGALILCWALISLTFIDFDTQLLPDDITLPLIWAGLLINIPSTFVTLHQAVIGAAAGYLSLWSIYWLFKLITGKEGMGFGDFKLLAALGAWMGWTMLLPIVLISSVVGAVVGIGLMTLARHGKHVPIPFGPYLALGGLIALFWGPALLQAYLPFLM